jgi:hypothetical protein
MEKPVAQSTLEFLWPRFQWTYQVDELAKVSLGVGQLLLPGQTNFRGQQGLPRVRGDRHVTGPDLRRSVSSLAGSLEALSSRRMIRQNKQRSAILWKYA